MNTLISSDCKKGIKSIHLPWDSRNPYQKRLAIGLTKLDVLVEKARENFFFLPEIMKINPDILHFHWLNNYFFSSNKMKSLVKLIAFNIQIRVLKFKGVKIVWTMHNLKNHNNRYLVFDFLGSYLVARQADAIFAHCETAKKMIADKFRLKNSDKITVIPLGNFIDDYPNTIDRYSARRDIGLLEDDMVMLFLGNIRYYKGVFELIECFKNLSPETNSKLVIAGNVPDDKIDKTLRTEIAGWTNIKYFPGFVPEESIQVFMKAADVVVLPYRDILTSAAVILAMSYGKAIISSQIGCLKDVLDSSGAFLYKANDNEELFRAMNRAIENKANLQKMGDHNRKLAEQWNWDIMANITHDVYQQCLNK